VVRGERGIKGKEEEDISRVKIVRAIGKLRVGKAAGGGEIFVYRIYTAILFSEFVSLYALPAYAKIGDL